MKTHFVIGATGQVAKALFQSLEGSIYCSSRASCDHDLRNKKIFLDLEREESITDAFRALDGLKTRVQVFLPGAWTAVDQCEQNPEKSFRINALGPEIVARECAKRAWPLLFFSTEYVFGEAEYRGGSIGPFGESDPIAPSCVYGRHKADAEARILSIAPSSLIIRTTMIFSFDPSGLNFAMQVYRTLTAPDSPATIPRIPSDQISTPTYAQGLAEASIALMDKGQSGIFHIVGDTLLGRPEFIRQLVATFRVPEDRMNRFQFVKTSQLQQPAKRPLSAGLKTDKACIAGIKIWRLEDALRDLGARAALYSERR